MNDSGRDEREALDGQDAPGGFEERMRDLLAEDAFTIRPSPAPYPAIRRRGLRERRRRTAAIGTAVAVLAAVPVGAYALDLGDRNGPATAAPRPSVTAAGNPAAGGSPKAPASQAGPARPATPGQLLDGISFAQATQGLEKCLRFDAETTKELAKHAEGGTESPAVHREDLGKASQYRIILAMRSTGDSNAPGDGYHVVAVREQPRPTRVICTIRDGQPGINSSSGDMTGDAAHPVYPDINSGKLYQQSIIDKGSWKLPFRWGIIGTVHPSVAKVTASYGDSTVPGVLDHGWFVAYGTLNRQVTKAPHIKGYDAAGKLVYDSDRDKEYDKTLP
ncbi:hypothetical protein MTQ10_12770 [Streptomyces sp. XM83C]|jgi:hypothetical protein|uniref:Uncharacterized protein n=1 Tax=Streptomyces thermocoprophilus TaxID=78356 RepID=A0ABV5VAK2_9ACTN|nr:hypothetical protein [Streptomyces sp. XM83C]MCK1820463.1 hypothetical protein [Streptomyces sp. XM83C]